MVISFIAFALNPYPYSVFKASENRCYIKTLENREDHEGGLQPCDKTRQGTGGSSEMP
jgi:hypothetical protein